MKLSHVDIDELVNDLRGWVSRKRNPGDSFVRTGFNGAVKQAIYRFHRDGDMEGAHRHLEALMNSYGLKNPARRQMAEQMLSGYMDWFGESEIVTAQTKLRLSLHIDDEIILGGEIPRIDILSDSYEYRGILIGETSTDWRTKLRMPVIQLAIANSLDRDPSEVGVGVQNLDGSGLLVTQYSEIEIQEAFDEVRGLAQQARRLIEAD